MSEPQPPHERPATPYEPAPTDAGVLAPPPTGAPVAGLAAPVPPAGAAPVFASPHLAPVHPGAATALTAPPKRHGPLLGIVALIAGALAAVVPPVFGALAGYHVGMAVGRQIATVPGFTPRDLAFLAPVREWVLVGELAFWGGTVLGLWALVQGIVAIVKNRGRIAAITAVVVAVVAAIAFVLATWAAFAVGAEAGSSIGG